MVEQFRVYTPWLFHDPCVIARVHFMGRVCVFPGKRAIILGDGPNSIRVANVRESTRCGPRQGRSGLRWNGGTLKKEESSKSACTVSLGRRGQGI